MANADFNQKQDSSSGGFDAASYRAPAKSSEQAVRLSPLQQKLAGFEKKLPAALRQQTVALLLAVAIMLCGFVGFGSGKLRSKYSEACRWYTSGLSADGGYALADELSVRENTAANILTTAKNTEGIGEESAEYQSASAALSAFASARAAAENGGGMHELYEANKTLDKAIDLLYAKMQELSATPTKMGAVQGQYGQFNSAQTIIGTLTYNDAVADYNDSTGGFPASLLKGLAGVKEVEQFA